MWRKIRQQWYWWGLAVVAIFAAVIRFYKIGSVPHGMTWDEAAIGYNGFAVWVARRDEWLNFLPISFRSFGDFKAPLAIYINGFFTVVLGMKLWVVRLPFVLAGIVGVMGMSMVVQQWLRHESVRLRDGLALLAGVLVATMPWHVHFTRMGFESGMALTWLVWGWWSWSESLHPMYTWTRKWKWPLALAAVVLWAMAIYTYHSAKIVVPLLGLVGLWFWWPRLQKNPRLVLAQLGLGLVTMLPLVYDSVTGQGAERFNQATLFNKGYTAPEIVMTMGRHLLAHLTTGFWVMGETPTLRHGDGQWGVLLLSQLMLLVVGLLAVVKWQGRSSELMRSRLKIWWLGLGWVLIGLLPAVMGIDVPHSNRALLALPGVMLLSVLGAVWMWDWAQAAELNKKLTGSHGEKHLFTKSLVGTGLLLHFLLFFAYQAHYYRGFAGASVTDFQDGYVELFKVIHQYERDPNSRFQNYVISNRYGQGYIYALFVRRTNPIRYHQGSLIKYLFQDKVTEGDLSRLDALVVATAEDLDLPVERAQHVIYGGDGKPRFFIFETLHERP